MPAHEPCTDRRPAQVLLALTATAAVVGGGLVGTANASHFETRIDSGGTTTRLGDTGTWLSDRGAVGGRSLTAAATTGITGTTTDWLYRSSRVGLSSYQVRVPTAGNHRVTLRFAETAGKRAGERVFDVALEGRTAFDDLDVARAAGSNAAHIRTADVLVKDGTLSIGFVAVKGEPMVSAVHVEAVAATSSPVVPAPSPSPSAPPAATPSPSTSPSTSPSASPSATPAPSAPSPTTGTASRSCTQVAQHGVTFALAAAYPCGTFANGDWWVAPTAAGRQVVVTGASPAAGGERHGLMANPSSKSVQAFDGRVGGFTATANVSLPYTAAAGTSLVKAVSASGFCGNGTGHPSCLSTAVVLTVLRAVPAHNGSTSFRPPYFGSHKPLLSTTAIRTDLLPRLAAPTSGGPTLAQVRTRFARVQLDMKATWQGRYLHPAENFRSYGGDKVSNYGSDLARDNNDAALRLMLGESAADKMPALVNYLQAGIDWYGAGRAGVDYHSDGGHNVGRKVVVTFAGVILDNADIKAVAGRTDGNAYSENGQVYYSPVAKRALFGKGCSTGMYDKVRLGGSGSRDCRDPLGLIDGGEIPGGVYQKCCTAKAFQGASLVTRLLPGGRTTWNADHFHEYVNRWMTVGTWSAPDSQSRFLAKHGTNAGTGSYGSTFQTAMWQAYSKG